ncbi:phosphorylated adapter RNA export protein [Anthonomus grandis grandis]|uniref:phosphorylated adapter RNA export protein n=1 Tax=Anthonomus grandis grandis TaxID=2921223 RepID=UPI0021656301|nr:phosphorylated adapter RNA export protein [Anthonomus grandis grandis]
MDQDELSLEEGEIEDDNEEVGTEYTPLPRPETYALDAPHRRFPEVSTKYSDSEEDLQSSDSDSGSDCGVLKSKRAKKVKISKRPLPQRQGLNKKYDIWSTRAQEDVLAETMINCDVTLKDRTRDVESYDFSLAMKFYEQEENTKQGTKRTRNDMKNGDFKPAKRKESTGVPKEIPKLAVDCTNTLEEIAKDIADKLDEKRSDLILKTLEVMGAKSTIDVFEKTREVEREGGLPILNQSRRRTSGGVFLYFVRNHYHITPEQRNEIFGEDVQKYNKDKKRQRKKKMELLKAKAQLAREKILPSLVSRADLLLNTTRKQDPDGDNCTNPPPSPESRDGMAPESKPVILSDLNDKLDNIRGELKTYDDDFLDISCENEMDLF